MQGISFKRRTVWSAFMAAVLRPTSTSHSGITRLRGGSVFSIAAEARAAGVRYDDMPGDGSGQARRPAAPAAGWRGGGGRGRDIPIHAAQSVLRHAYHGIATLMIMTWPVAVVGLAVAEEPTAAVFAYVTTPDQLAAPPLRLELPDARTWALPQ